MNNPESIHLPAPNPVTRSRHQQQMWIQILLPVLVGAALIIFLAVMTAVASDPQVVRFSDISIIFLILPTAVTGLIVLAVFGAIIFLLARLLKIVPSYAHLTQIYLERVTEIIKGMADKAADPVVAIESGYAGFKVLFQRRNHHQG